MECNENKSHMMFWRLGRCDVGASIGAGPGARRIKNSAGVNHNSND